jgi:hypothetical protein
MPPARRDDESPADVDGPGDAGGSADVDGPGDVDPAELGTFADVGR